jgi:hypothetical protein
MNNVVHILWVMFWVFGSLLAFGAGLSLLLFVTGLLSFIRHERRLAANWNKLTAMHLNGRKSEARRSCLRGYRLAHHVCADAKRRS